MGAIVVTGSSGNVGGSVVRALSAAGVPFVTTHRPGGPPSGGGVAGVELDFADPSTWSKAFSGADSLLLVRPPAIGNVRRDLLPAVAAAREAGVRQVVFVSLQGVDRIPVAPHAAVERWLRASGMSWTFVRPSFFDQNLSGIHAADIRERDELYLPAGTGATAFVDVEDVGAVAAAALIDPGRHAGRVWTTTGPEALTYDEVAEVLSAELGRRIRYARPGVLGYARQAHARLGMAWPMVAVTSAIYTSARLGLAAGLTGDVAEVLQRDPTSFAVFARREHAAWTS